MRYLVASVLAVAMVASTPAMAQQPGAFGPRQGDWELTLRGAGENDRRFERGSFSLGGELGHYLTPEWSVSLWQDVTWAGGRDTMDQWSGATRVATDFHFDLGQMMDRGHLRPFVGGNFGYKYGRNIRDSWMIGPHAGVKWYLQEQTFIVGRVGYDWEFRRAREFDDGFRRGSFVYTLGVGLNF